MSEIHIYWFLVIAIMMAIIFGRLGTLLKDQIEKAKNSTLKKNKLS